MWKFEVDWKRALTAEKSFYEKVDFQWVKTTVLFFAVCGPKFTRLCQQTRERSQFAPPFSDCRYLVLFRRYSRSKCEDVRNCAGKKHVFSAPIFFWGGWPQILDLVVKTAPISDHVARFRGDRPWDRGDLALSKKRKTRNIWQRPTSGRSGYALASLGQFLARVKIWGASTPCRPKCSLSKNSTWVRQHARL